MTDILFLDTEWTFGTGYDLKTLSYPEYEQHPNAHPTLVTWALNDEPINYSHDFNDLQHLPWDSLTLVCHNTLFDGYMLRKRFGFTAKRYFCTLAAMRALAPEIPHGLGACATALGIPIPKDVGALETIRNKTLKDLTEEQLERFITYGINDTETCRQIYHRVISHMPPTELDLLDLTLRMGIERELHVDTAELQAIQRDEIKRIADLIAKTPYTREQLSSNPQFVEILESLAIQVPYKVSPRTGKDTPALSNQDIGFHRLWHDYPQHTHVLNARKAAKNNLVTSRCARYLSIGNRMPCMYNYGAAHTLRWGGASKINLQNLPRHDDTPAGRLRGCLTAPPGYVLVVVDSSNIERRVLDYLADHEPNLKIFREGGDLYLKYASMMYGREVTKEEKDLRNAGKVLALSTGYGMGWSTYQVNAALGPMGAPPMLLTDREAMHHINIARDPYLRGLWASMEQGLFAMLGQTTHDHKFIEFRKWEARLPTGIPFSYAGLTIDEEHNFRYGIPEPFKHLYSGIVTENLTQRIARDINGWQTLLLEKEVAPVVLVTHDEDVLLVPESQADDALAAAIEIVSTPPSWAPGLPLAAEGGYDQRYSK